MHGLYTHHCFTAGPFTGYVEANRIIPKSTHPWCSDDVHIVSRYGALALSNGDVSEGEIMCKGRGVGYVRMYVFHYEPMVSLSEDYAPTLRVSYRGQVISVNGNAESWFRCIDGSKIRVSDDAVSEYIIKAINDGKTVALT